METIKKVLCLLLVVAMLVATAGCGKEEAKRKKKKKIVVIKRSSVSENVDDTDTEDDEDTADDDYVDEYLDYVRRELATAEAAVSGRYIEKFVPEYTVKKVSWNGPKGYVIVYPKDNFQLMVVAKKIQKYFAENCNTALAVKDDSSAVTSKEILVGDTNRRKSKLSAKEYAMTFDGNKLYIESGNFNGVLKAVKWFVSFVYKSGELNLVSGKYEFEAAKKRADGVYNFVWGDEFDGNTLDSSNWELTTHMGLYGATDMTLSKDPRVINVSDGRLKLTAQRWFDPDDPMVQYAACYTVEAKKHANFQYGYLEMCARYPIKAGAWPSLWLSGNCTDGVMATKYGYTNGDIFPSDFKAEIDILEYTSLLPNLHKWYFNGDHSDYNDGSVKIDGVARKAKGYKLEEEDSYVYHIFGFDWTPDTLKMYCDGKEFMSFDLKNNIDGKGDMSDFLNPMFIRFNNHIIPEDVPTNKSSLPCEYYIDYIRLYQRSDIGGLWLAE